MKKYILLLAIAFILLSSPILKPVFAEESVDNLDKVVFQTLERIETIVYGGPQTGGLLPRLSRAEKDIFGRELPGSLTERQTAIIEFLEKETATQPSLLFKLAVAEWAVLRKTYPIWPLSRRVEQLESITDGLKGDGALSGRLEKLITKILPEGVLANTITLPAATIVKASLTKTLSVKNIKLDDKLVLNLLEDILFDGNLVAPKGSRVLAHISKRKPPRSFGRGSEIEIEFDYLESIGPANIALVLGDSAKQAMEADAAMYGAAGASIAGAAILGPLGLVGGFLIRGSDNQVKEGTVFYIETESEVNVNAYKIPGQISSITTSGDVVAPQGNIPSNS
ncbi:MAG: hypothetical protein GXZ13_01350 [Synergistaceae bacterium]|jgi:hypothetical protein|nr:hypothetical protein [Synergistaceae bacterium]